MTAVMTRGHPVLKTLLKHLCVLSVFIFTLDCQIEYGGMIASSNKNGCFLMHYLSRTLISISTHKKDIKSKFHINNQV